jgi:hypothetical protein
MHDLTEPLAGPESRPIRAGTNLATHQWWTLEQMLFVPPNFPSPP